MVIVWIRYLSAPWVVRWACNLVVPAVFLIADFTVVAGVREPAPTALVWAGSVVVVGAVVMAALLTRVLDSRLAPQRALVTGLTASQRAQVAAATKPKGSTPDDPAVIVASIASMSRLATLNTRRQWLLVFVVLLGTLYAGWLMRDPATRGVAIVLLAADVWMLVAFGIRLNRRRRIRQRYDDLLAAAAAHGITEAPQPAFGRMSWSDWACVVGMFLVLSLGAFGISFAMGPPPLPPGCREAEATINVILDHQLLLDPARITPSGPSIQQYRQWAQQLHANAVAGVDNPPGPVLNRVAELADRAVGIVEELRSLPPAAIPDAAGPREAEFRETITHLLVAEQPLATACHDTEARIGDP